MGTGQFPSHPAVKAPEPQTPVDPNQPQMGWIEGMGIFPSSSDDKNPNGIVTWAQGDQGPLELYRVDMQDPRYQACLAEAHQLKKQYPLDGVSPDVMKKNEKEIVQGLNKVIHKEYGDYNTVVKKDEDQSKPYNNEPTLKDDIGRAQRAAQGKGIPPSSGPQDKPTGTLICRDYAAVGERLLDEAGIPNNRVNGTIELVNVHGNGQVETPEKAGEHAYNISRRTGAVIDFSFDAKGFAAYTPSVNPSDAIGSPRHSVITDWGHVPATTKPADAVENFVVYSVGDGAHHKQLPPDGSIPDQTMRETQQADRDAVSRYMQTPEGQHIAKHLQDMLIEANAPMVQVPAPPLPTPATGQQKDSAAAQVNKR